jgi:phosphoglycolate phosphatase
LAIKGILFDKDGTLLDFERTYAPGTVDVIADLARGEPVLSLVLAESVDFDLGQQKFRPGSVIIAGTGRLIAEAWLPHLPHWQIESLAAEVDRLYSDYSEMYVAPFEVLDPALQRLEEMGLVLGVATNDAETSARRHIEKIGQKSRFGFIAGYDSGHGAKPGPGMVEAFARHIGAGPHEIMMVGDSLHDLHAGKAAGSLAIAMTTGLAIGSELAPHADHVLDSLSELPDLVIQYNNPDN